MDPIVSIGMPVYNGERYLEEALDSLLSQSFTDFELIISDNDSTDNTEEICKRYAARDGRIKYQRFDKNMGATQNYNHVVAEAVGKYFKWAAHDDLCKPTYLQRCVEVLDNDPEVGLCYPKTTIINEDSERVKDFDDGLDLSMDDPYWRYRGFHRRFRAPGECNAVFGVMRTALLKRTPRIGNYPASDKVLLAEFALLGKFHEVPENLFLRRDHEQTSIRSNPSYADRAAWFDPNKRHKLVFSSWRWLLEYIRTINRVPLSFSTRWRCYLETFSWVIWSRRHFFQDLVDALREILHRSAAGRFLVKCLKKMLRR